MYKYTINERGYRDYASINDLKEAVNELFTNRTDQNDVIIVASYFNLFFHLFGNMPCITDCYILNNYLKPDKKSNANTNAVSKNVTEFLSNFKKVCDLENEITPELAIPEDVEEKYDVDENKTMQNLMELYKDNCLVYRNDDRISLITNDFIVTRSYQGIVFYMKDLKLSDDVINAIVKIPASSNKKYNYVVRTSNGFDTNTLEIKHLDIDLDLLYNDDLPHEEIMNFLSSDDSGLLIFHGEPGTGKSSYIRYLMEQFPDEKFMLLNQSVFNYMTDASFIQLMIYNANSVIILEDCEGIVKERTDRNSILEPLLNLTDGIIGDSFNLKFICTFNTSISNIDKALLRKGRLKMKYEFKKLDKAKIEKIAENKGINLADVKEMTLADIMNYDEFNGNVNNKQPIGFKK